MLTFSKAKRKDKMNLDEFLTQPLVKPKHADYIECEYEGVKFYIYGILHGITGGTNREYANFINETIKEAKGLKLAEQSMLKMYKGLDGELDDWVQMTSKDAFIMTLKMLTSPIAICSIIKTTIKEKLKKNDRFNLNDRRLQDMGGTPYFHLLSPSKRRRYMGFPSPKDYLIENYKRRHGESDNKAIVFPDKDWKWLTYIEKNVNIPYRSIHMIETAVVEAKKKNAKEVSLFIGEIHNSDIQWYITRDKLEDSLEAEIAKIKAEAIHTNKIVKKISYLSSIAAATLLSIMFYIIIAENYKLIL